MSEDDNGTFDVSALAAQTKAELNAFDYNEKFNVYDYATPYPKQLEVMNASARADSIFFRSANQAGKSWTLAYMVAMHALQRYPKNYTGWKPDKPIVGAAKRLQGTHTLTVWVVSQSAAVGRDTNQLRLVGDYGANLLGTGLVPLDAIASVQTSRGVAGALDSIVIKRGDGTTCLVAFKSMEAGRAMAQGSSVDLVLVDELCELDLWLELQARTTATSGKSFLFATERGQFAQVPEWFQEPNQPKRLIIQGTLEDAGHVSKQQIEDAKAKYANNLAELRSRVYGEAFAGGGSVLYAPQDAVGMDRPFSSFGNGMRAIIGIDPSHQGLSDQASASAAVFCLYHKDNDCLFVIEAWKQKKMLLESFAARVLTPPFWRTAPVAWGQGESQIASSGKSYAELLRTYGLKCLPSHATLPGGGVDLDAQFSALQSAMSNGRLRINNHLYDLWQEIRGLERDEKGNIANSNKCDLLAALRYAYLMRKNSKEIADTNDGGVFGNMSGRNAPWNSPEAIRKRTEFEIF
jgi:phage terminase large subunit-like protein